MYLTLEELKEYFLEWNEAWNLYAQKLIEISEARIRQEFKRRGRNLIVDIENERVELLLLKSVIAGMVKRVLNTGSMPVGDITNVSQSAGAYSASYTLSNASSAMFIRKDEFKMLGLSNNGFIAFNTFTGETYINGRKPEETE